MNVEIYEITRTAIGFGSVLAITISWSLNKSIFWAIFHGFCSWFYIIYYAVGNPDNDNLKD
jgi:hypothetical protein